MKESLYRSKIELPIATPEQNIFKMGLISSQFWVKMHQLGLLPEELEGKCDIVRPLRDGIVSKYLTQSDVLTF